MEWDPLTVNGIGVPEPARLSSFYGSLHRTIAEAGGDGVKVDVQSIAGALGGSTFARRCHAALEASVVAAFGCGSRCINCMCHASDALFSQRETSVVRACDDFYPADTSSHTAHLVQATYNSVLLEAFAWPDWDMFQSGVDAGAMHAAARAVSGCAVYVSDAPGAHDSSVLRRVCLESGRVPLASQPALPTRDCLLEDVAAPDGTMPLKIFTVNREEVSEGRKRERERRVVGGVLGVFNVRGARWCTRTRRYVHTDSDTASATEGRRVSTVVRPSDVETLAASLSPCDDTAVLEWVACVRVCSDGGGDAAADDVTVRRVDATRGVFVSLSPGAFAIASFSPVVRVCSSTTAVSCAALGLWELYNGNGAVLSVGVSVADRDTPRLLARLLGPGVAAFWCNQVPLTVSVDGRGVPHAAVTACTDQGGHVVTVTLPSRQTPEVDDVWEVELVW